MVSWEDTGMSRTGMSTMTMTTMFARSGLTETAAAEVWAYPCQLLPPQPAALLRLVCCCPFHRRPLTLLQRQPGRHLPDPISELHMATPHHWRGHYEEGKQHTGTVRWYNPVKVRSEPRCLARWVAGQMALTAPAAVPGGGIHSPRRPRPQRVLPQNLAEEGLQAGGGACAACCSVG